MTSAQTIQCDKDVVVLGTSPIGEEGGENIMRYGSIPIWGTKSVAAINGYVVTYILQKLYNRNVQLYNKTYKNINLTYFTKTVLYENYTDVLTVKTGYLVEQIHVAQYFF